MKHFLSYAFILLISLISERENNEISILQMYVTEENGPFNPRRILLD